jgi:hypothetical protein
MRSNLTETRLAELWDLARRSVDPDNAFGSEEMMVFRQYQAIHSSLAKPWKTAPEKVIQLAKSIMPLSSRRFLVGKLVHPKPLLGFARGAISQVQFESEEVQVRIQIEEVPTGWKMWGRTSQPGWIVWSGSSSVVCNRDGEFELDIRSGSIEPLSIQNESTTILLPMIIDENGDGNI